MKSNILMTWMSGKEFCKTDHVRCFVNSTKVINSADKIVFTHDMEEDIKEWIISENFKVVEVNPKEVVYPIGDRHLHYWRYLINNSYDLAMHVDSKDVIFQSDPFEWLSNKRKSKEETFKYPNYAVVLMEEGMPPSSNGFHLIEQFNFQSTIPENFKQSCREVVLNSGVLMGTAHEFSDHLFKQWIAGIVGSSNCTDQANLNYMYCYLKESPIYHISSPHKENLCLTGEAIKGNYVDFEYKDGLFKHKLGSPYCIFHQWDRTKFENDIIERYGK